MTFDWGVVWQYRDLFLQGLGMTVFLTVATMLLAIPGGLTLAFIRMAPLAPARWAATAFVEFFRATPLVLQIYWAYYVLPVIVDVRLSAVTTALIGLTCNISAFNSETFRAGILSIRQGQVNAGLALGMGRAQVMWYIVLPQAVMRVLPSLASTWVSLFKDTSLVSVIAVPDLSYMAFKVRAETYRILEVLSAMAALYWLLGYPQAKLVDWIHRKFKVVE
jgi:His/Glu/Gln/Arg/opine family amino acid ABC transporter permease subunit